MTTAAALRSSTLLKSFAKPNVERVDGAILDVAFPREDVTLVVDALLDRGIPFIFCTGAGVPSALQQRSPDAPVHSKPVTPEVLIRPLGAFLARGEQRPATA